MSSSVAYRMHQSPRAAAVACRKNLKATAADCYDFTEVEAEDWRAGVSTGVSTGPGVSTKTRPSVSTGVSTSGSTGVSTGLRVEITCGSRESRHSRHSRHIISY